MNANGDQLSRFLNLIANSMPERIIVNQERTDTLLNGLFTITEGELEKLGHKDSTCSICIQPFLAILAEEESASAMETPAFFSGELGVTRLSQPWQCGHIFCRRDITKWIKTGKLTCPMCRKSLLEPGTRPEEQESDADIDAQLHDLFTRADDADMAHIFSGQAPFNFGPAVTRHNRQNTNNDDIAGNEYSGMYS